MSVTAFPIGYPTTGFIEATFVPARRQSAGVLGDGRDIVVDRGQPQWTASLKTQPLFAAQIGAWEAFHGKLRGGSRFFLGWDPRHEYPAAYMPGGWGSPTRAIDGNAFDGTAALTAIGYSGLPGVGRDTVSLAGLPAGFVFTPGDHLSLSWGANLLTNPNAIDLSPWQSDFGTVTPDGVVAPDGSTTGDILTATTSGAIVDRYQAVAASPALKPYLFSTWLRRGSMSGAAYLLLEDGGGAGQEFLAVVSPSSAAFTRVSAAGAFPAAASSLIIAGVGTVSAQTSGATLDIWGSSLIDLSAAKYSLHGVLDADGVTADGNGNATLWVEPELPASVPLWTAQANLHRACAKFRLASFDLPIAASGRNRPGQATFTALSTQL